MFRPLFWDSIRLCWSPEAGLLEAAGSLLLQADGMVWSMGSVVSSLLNVLGFGKKYQVIKSLSRSLLKNSTSVSRGALEPLECGPW